MVAHADGDHKHTLAPWLERELERLLRSATGHALLLHGPPGVGQFELAIAAAHAWLCEQSQGAPGRYAPACGLCASCRLIAARTHPDRLPLIPESLAPAWGWGGGDDGEPVEKTSGAKASKEIKIAAVRQALTFTQLTSSRGGAKILVVHPAEQLNEVAANALLKTLEEPPGHARFILSAATVDKLPPTIRSRCQAFGLPLPDAKVARRWLSEQGVDEPEVLLMATGGQPLEALLWSKEGITAAMWTALPQQLSQGQSGLLVNWPLVRVIETLQKICHDAMRLCALAPPRYFAAGTWPENRVFNAAELAAWSRNLQAQHRHAEHPWNQSLAVQSLVEDAARALNCGLGTTRAAGPLRRSPPDRAGIR